MFHCCCIRVHRHQLHLASYGFVSLSLILAGFVFTVFAIFQKDSQIGKIWLAGPVLIVVGSVLCGKVMIDWGPAMQRGRGDSMDSRMVDEMMFSNLIPVASKHNSLVAGGDPLRAGPAFRSRPSVPTMVNSYPIQRHSASSSLSSQRTANHSSSPRPGSDQFPFDRIIYGTEQSLPNHHTFLYGPIGEENGAMEAEGEERRQMRDQTTQAREQGCEKCATLWSILERKRKSQENGPRVIGNFVFGSMLDRAGGTPPPNYGSLDAERQQNNGLCGGSGGRRKAHSQGETLIMNERSFLI